MAKIRPSWYKPPRRKVVVEEDPPGLMHVGGGWYELPGGERVQGKEAALAALEAVKLGG